MISVICRVSSREMMTALLQFLCTLLIVQVRSENTKRVFSLLTILPYPSQDTATNPPSWDAGHDVRPAMDLAVDQINQRSDILSNYSLQLVHSADGCDEYFAQITFASFVEGIYAKEVKNLVGIIGPGCSSSTTHIAPLAGRPEIEMVTVHDAGSPNLANITVNPHLLGVLGSTKSFIESFQYLISQGNWSRIALLYEDSRLYFINTKRRFLDQLSSNVNVEYISPVTSTHIPLMDIQQKRLRVVFILASISLAQNIICLALNRSMLFGRYQFVLMSARLEDFVEQVSFDFQKNSYNCSAVQIKSSLNNSFLVYYNLLPKANEPLLANLSYSEFLLSYEAYRKNYNKLTGQISSETYWANNLYDAVWAWAVVLDSLTKENEDFEFIYGDTDTADRIVQEFYRLNFEGMSGTVAFDNSTGFIDRDVVISQVQGNESYFLTFIGPKADKRCNGTSENESSGFCGTRPMFINDSYVDREMRESKEVAIFFVLITLIQFFLVVALHVLTFVYRNSPSVKASSLKLVNISFIGTYILLLGTFLRALYSAAAISSQLMHYFCQMLWVWTFPVGFSIAFGPIVMKTWRLYRIFEHYLDPGPFISTPYMLLGTTLITLMYIIVAIGWTALDSFEVCHREYFDDIEFVRVLVYYCTSKYSQYLLVANSFLFLLLLSSGTILGLMTRKIPNASFATSSLRVMVHLMAIVVTLGLSLYVTRESSLYVTNQLAPGSDRMSYFSFITLCTLLNTVIFLFIACVFAPPLLPCQIKQRRGSKRSV